jgi:hypothetical protein
LGTKVKLMSLQESLLELETDTVCLSYETSVRLLHLPELCCAVRRCRVCPLPPPLHQVLGAKVKLMSLQESLLELETDTVEVVAGLVTEFDRSYSEMAEANKLQYNAYFTQVRFLCAGCHGVDVPSTLPRWMKG